MAKDEIYENVNKSRLSLPELKEVFLATKFPIAFVVVGTIKALIRLVDGFTVNPYFEAIKFSVYYYWLTQSYQINRANYKL